MEPDANTDFFLLILHAKAEEAISSVNLASLHFEDLVNTTRLVGSLLEKAKHTSNALQAMLATSAETHANRNCADGLTAKLGAYHKLVREMDLTEDACHDLASRLAKCMATLETTERFHEPLVNLFIDSAVLFSMTHVEGGKRRRHGQTIVVVGQYLIDKVQSGLEILKASSASELAEIGFDIPAVMKNRALFERVMSARGSKHSLKDQLPILLRFANTAFTRKHSEEEITTFNLRLSGYTFHLDVVPATYVYCFVETWNEAAWPTNGLQPDEYAELMAYFATLTFLV
ncbi:hypothetical protein SCHPADRAFT_942303 [Schizopora paradoxa]|uniref:Uncharacterized protein n=1 Tax=Schizopora paradoxa TaxID=27342 RepID=A0A0H2RNY0_9AGAM|nr:hypothetical protein SCHPADRAFT_942303 [Schizopora paradoxa]